MSAGKQGGTAEQPSALVAGGFLVSASGSWCGCPREFRVRPVPPGWRRGKGAFDMEDLAHPICPGSAMAKAYDPSAYEQRLYDWWASRGFFKPETQVALGQADPGAEPFVISMPPPNITGALHTGHVIPATMEDLMIRYHRLRGRPALWVPGTDHAGIATQNVVERALQAEGTSRYELGREAFIARVWQWRETYGRRITEQHRRLGVSCDWDRERFTLDEGLSRAVATAFVRLYERGLIYRSRWLVNWCPRCRSVISDIEVEHHAVAGKMYEFRYPLADGGFLPVATTRPETILGDTAVAVHPEDPRYAHLVGRSAVVPAIGRHIPIIADAYVDREFGTGALKVTPAHDPNDYEIGKRHGLAEINILNPDGTLNENAGPYAGLDRYEARERLWTDMGRDGLVIGEKVHEHAVGHCQRCHTMVEPMLSTQWFVRMAPLAEPAIRAVRDGEIAIVPERFTAEYYHWLENIRDWVISRQLWWGHRIPVWYGPDGEPIAALDETAARDEARRRYGAEVPLRQDEDVLDTWFSSALWPFSTLGWPDDTPDYRRYYPTSVLETGYDILFFWVARMIFMGLAMTGQVPFRLVYLHGLIRDAGGRKMSKSMGNAPDPIELIDRYGCDALRFMLATAATPGQDMVLSEERLEGSRNFANKLWNIGRFIVSHLTGANGPHGTNFSPLEPNELEARWDELSLVDRWIWSRHNEVVTTVTDLFTAHRYGDAGRELNDFLWSDFADWYLEAVKMRLQGADDAAAARTRQLLYNVFERSLTLLHPFMPFLTEALWGHLPRRPDSWPALMMSRWPAPGRIDRPAMDAFRVLQDLVRGIRNARAENHVEPGRRIEALVRAGELAPLWNAERAAIAFLARLDESRLQIDASGSPPPVPHATVVAAEGVVAWLPLAGMMDLEKERARLAGELEAVQAEVRRLEQRLADEQFLSRAPETVIARERDRLSDARARQAALGDRLAQLSRGA